MISGAKEYIMNEHQIDKNLLNEMKLDFFLENFDKIPLDKIEEIVNGKNETSGMTLNEQNREKILAHLAKQPFNQCTMKKISTDLGLTSSDVSRALAGANIEKERKGNVMVVKLKSE